MWVEAAVVAIASGDEFGEASGGGGVGVALAHAAATDEGDLYFVVGRDFSGLLIGSEYRHTHAGTGHRGG